MSRETAPDQHVVNEYLEKARRLKEARRQYRITARASHRWDPVRRACYDCGITERELEFVNGAIKCEDEQKRRKEGGTR